MVGMDKRNRVSTDKLKAGVETLRSIERDMRAEMVEMLQEEDVLSRVDGNNDAALAAKYNLGSMGGGPQ